MDNKSFSSPLGKKQISFFDALSTILFVFVLVVFLIFIVFSCTYTADKVSGESMSPTYKTGDIVYSCKTDKLNYGDIVIIHTNDEKDIIKRVIGLSGDKIEIKQDVTGYYYVYRNGKRLHEPYINGIAGNSTKHNEFCMTHGESIIVGENEFFVLGDNRAHSKDSAQYGCFGYDKLLGRVDYLVEKGNQPLLDLFVQLFLPIFK